jgi:hydrogenase nickel incorporation protein HypA/HybF
MPRMHEVALIENVIALVEDQRRTDSFSRVHRIRLQVGALGHAEPDCLRFCFDAVARGTIADGATLEIDMVAGQGHCPACRCIVALDERFAPCPLCANPEVRIIVGDELRLAELEVE